VPGPLLMFSEPHISLNVNRIQAFVHRRGSLVLLTPDQSVERAQPTGGSTVADDFDLDPGQRTPDGDQGTDDWGDEYCERTTREAGGHRDVE
jgi:hypothetical protein